MKIEVPKKAEEIIRTLQEHGYDAYVVGGCVRDSLLHRSPADWDITTSAKPMEVKSVFKRTVDTGLQHGTVTVMLGKEGFEVTTYRIDGEYEDSRHPKEVTFTGNLEEDLKRRDFTINAMAYNSRTGLVDVFGGIEDLENKVVRCVGNPRERFTEDALRILRAVRFSAQLGFTIDEATREAAEELGETLKNISAERIQAELIKLITSQNPHFIKTAWELGLTRVFLPEFDRIMEREEQECHAGEHTLKALEFIEGDKVLRLAVLFHEMGDPREREKIVKQVLRRLKFDNDTIHKVSRLVLWKECPWSAEPAAVRKALSQVGPELFPMLLKVRRADLMAQENCRKQENLEHLAKLEETFRGIMERQECFSIKMLAVSGKDLIAAGMKPGKEIGELLDQMLETVLLDPGKNTKEELLSLLKNE